MSLNVVKICDSCRFKCERVSKICDSCGVKFEGGDRAYFYKNKTFCPDCMYDELLDMSPAELIRLTDAKEFEFGEDF